MELVGLELVGYIVDLVGIVNSYMSFVVVDIV